MHQIITDATCSMVNVMVRAQYVRVSIEMAHARNLEAEPDCVPGSV